MEGYLAESLALAREAGDRTKICSLLTSLGLAAFNQGNWERTGTYLQDGLTLAREIGGRSRRATLLMSLAMVNIYQGASIVEIPSLLEESLALMQGLGHPEKFELLLSDQMGMFFDFGS